MNCPVCDQPLAEADANGVRIEVCYEGCGGMWLDRGRLIKLADPENETGDELVNILANRPVVADRTTKRSCPLCEGIKMMQQGFGRNYLVQVNSCANCGGIWLDGGELGFIREEFKERKSRATI